MVPKRVRERELWRRVDNWVDLREDHPALVAIVVPLMNDALSKAIVSVCVSKLCPRTNTMLVKATNLLNKGIVVAKLLASDVPSRGAGIMVCL